MNLPVLPNADLIATINNRVEAATREEYDDWRLATADALQDSGVRERTMEVCGRWGMQQVASGRMPQQQAGLAVLGGSITTAFQIGLLVGAVLYGSHKLDESEVIQ